MYLPLFLCLYESFWKGCESDQTETVNIAGYQMRLLDAPDKQTHLITSNVNSL